MSFPLATIILAAGKGSRMDSSLPKVLHKVGNKPMIEHVLQTAKHLKSSKIVTVLGYEQEIIRSFLQNQPIEVVIQSKQLGTAHAVLQCKTLLENFNGNILILYGDVPFIKMKTLTTLLQVHVAKKAESTILTTDLPNPFTAARYHSIIVESSSLPNCFDVIARNPNGIIMGLRHKKLPIASVQFHPESILSLKGHSGLRIISNMVSELTNFK